MSLSVGLQLGLWTVLCLWAYLAKPRACDSHPRTTKAVDASAKLQLTRAGSSIFLLAERPENQPRKLATTDKDQPWILAHFSLPQIFFFWYGKPTCSASLKLMRCSFLGGTQHGYFMYVVCVFEEAWGRCDILRGLEDSKAPSFSLPEEWDQAAHASLALQNSVLLFQSRKVLKWLTPAAVNCVQHSLCW